MLIFSWWRHQTQTFSTLLVLCEGNLPITGGFPPERPVSRSFDVFFDLRLNKRLSNQDTGDLRRCRAYYDVTVMCPIKVRLYQERLFSSRQWTLLSLHSLHCAGNLYRQNVPFQPENFDFISRTSIIRQLETNNIARTYPAFQMWTLQSKRSI